MVSAASLLKLGINCFTLADTVQPFLLSKAVSELTFSHDTNLEFQLLKFCLTIVFFL